MTANRTTHDGFIEALLEAPDDFSNYLIFADFLEENDQTDTAYCYRWMAKHKRHPWHRTELAKPVFLWAKEVVSQRKRKATTIRERAPKECPAAVLHRLLFLWPTAPHSGFIQFKTWGAAVSWLAVRLSAHRVVIGV